MIVVDYVGDIVAKTSEMVKTVITDEKIRETGVFYQYGHIVEIDGILNTMSQTTAQRVKKYPAILLLQDFLEKKGTQTGIETEVNLQLLIVTGSDKDYRVSVRYERIFKPVLYPIYECLMKVLKKDGRLANSYGEIVHNKIDRPNISGFSILVRGQTKQLFYDCLDAIEINNLNLKIKKTC
ncbi:MAG: hypothetical protein LBK94_11390 [Prevotellaceae bacterium]|jgi:hypothetical protein|nr:hypothetical protein [Prevotellaceae bacterium]